MPDDESDAEYALELPYWIDTDAYSDRDREMFVCGAEFTALHFEPRRDRRRDPRPIPGAGQEAGGGIPDGAPSRRASREGHRRLRRWIEAAR